MAARRDNYHHGQLREGLLAAALSLLDSEGVDAVTVRAVARAAGVAHSAPANHFKDRRALLTGLAVEIFKARAEEAEEHFNDGPSAPRERIKRFAHDWLGFGLAFPHRYRLIWRRDCLDPEDTTLNAEMDRIYDPLVTLFSDMNLGKKMSAESQAIALWSLLHGYISMRLDGNLVAAQDEVTGQPRADAILSLLLGKLD